MDNIHVLKFGGTSVSSPDVRAHAVAQVLSKRASGKAVVVVVSAMGRAGAPYATDTLLALFGDSQPTGHTKYQLVCLPMISYRAAVPRKRSPVLRQAS